MLNFLARFPKWWQLDIYHISMSSMIHIFWTSVIAQICCLFLAANLMSWVIQWRGSSPIQCLTQNGACFVLVFLVQVSSLFTFMSGTLASFGWLSLCRLKLLFSFVLSISCCSSIFVVPGILFSFIYLFIYFYKHFMQYALMLCPLLCFGVWASRAI